MIVDMTTILGALVATILFSEIICTVIRQYMLVLVYKSVL